MNPRRMAMACVLMLAIVVVVFWAIADRRPVASLSADTSSGGRVVCEVHAETGGYSIRTHQGSSGSSIVRIDSDAPPEDVSIERDPAAGFVVRIGKQRIRVEVDRP